MKTTLTVQWLLVAALAVAAMSAIGCKHDPPSAVAKPSLEEGSADTGPPVTDIPSPTISFRLDDRATITLLYVPPGRFRMGSPDDEVGRFPDELAHDVTISRGLYMSDTEITQAQWYAIMGDNPSYLAGNSRPIEHVSWLKAKEFCRRLSQATGRTCRLPTEAEWEYACRAGSTTAFSFGDNPAALGDYAWFQDNALPIKTHDVRLKEPNAWGFYDMHGNVREWCADVYGPYPESATQDPSGPGSDGHRVVRGGSWGYLASLCRSSHRQRGPEDMSDEYVGVRIVMEIDP